MGMQKWQPSFIVPITTTALLGVKNQQLDLSYPYNLGKLPTYNDTGPNSLNPYSGAHISILLIGTLLITCPRTLISL